MIKSLYLKIPDFKQIKHPPKQKVNKSIEYLTVNDMNEFKYHGIYFKELLLPYVPQKFRSEFLFYLPSKFYLNVLNNGWEAIFEIYSRGKLLAKCVYQYNHDESRSPIWTFEIQECLSVIQKKNYRVKKK